MMGLECCGGENGEGRWVTVMAMIMVGMGDGKYPFNYSLCIV